MSERKLCEFPGCTKSARIRFCSNDHKDRYHNLTNPRGYYSHLSDPSFDDADDALGEDYLLDCGDR